jgi:hypothetical protein
MPTHLWRRLLLPPLALLLALGSLPREGVAQAGGMTAGEAEVEGRLAQAVWTAASLERILGERDYPALLSLAFLNRSAERDTGWQGAAQALETALRDPGALRLDRCRALTDPVEGTLCSLETLVPLLPGGEGRAFADEGARLLGLYLGPASRPGSSPLLSGTGWSPSGGALPGGALRLAPLQDYAEGVLLETLRIAAPGLAALALQGADGGDGDGTPGDAPTVLRFAGMVAGLAGFDPGASAAQVLSGAPSLRTLLREHPTLASLEGSVSGTAGAAGGAFLETRAVLEEYRDFLAGSGGGASWATDRAFAFLASHAASAAGVGDGVTARIRALGNAAADLRLESRRFRSNLVEFGQQAALSALSGNVFGVAAGVAGFFQLTPGALGPSATEELRVIRGLVDDLRGEMTAGFAGVDTRLDQVLDELDGGFARIETLVASGQREVLAELGTVRDELRALSGRIDRLETNVVLYLEAGFDRDHARTMIRCLEHRERHLPPFDRMEFPVFSECLADFRARGSRDARDALLTDRTTPVDDVALQGVLRDPDPEALARRLPLVARAAAQRYGYPGMGGGQGGANPVEWGVAAESYLAMLHDWPEHAARVGPGDLEALLATGAEIQRILRGIVQAPNQADPGGALHPALEAYERAAGTLTSEGDLLARRHQQAQLRRVDPTTLLTRMSPEEVGRPVLPAPRRVAGNIPTEVRTAAVLALEEPVLVYRTMTTDSVTRANRRRAFLFFGRRHDRVTHARTAMEVELRLSSGQVVARFHTEGPTVLRRVEEMSGDTTSTRVRSVVEHVPDPAGHFIGEHFPALADDVSRWRLTPPDGALLRRLEGDIEEELRRAESQSLRRVFSSVCTAGPAGEAAFEALDAGDRESAGAIRRALDEMTTARVFLAAALRLGLPAGLEGHPELAAFLEGDAGILDRDALCRVVEAGESPLRVVWLEEEPRARATELRAALDRALEAQTALGAPPTAVDATLERLRAAIRLQQLRARVAG